MLLGQKGPFVSCQHFPLFCARCYFSARRKLSRNSNRLSDTSEISTFDFSEVSDTSNKIDLSAILHASTVAGFFIFSPAVREVCLHASGRASSRPARGDQGSPNRESERRSLSPGVLPSLCVGYYENIPKRPVLHRSCSDKSVDGAAGRIPPTYLLPYPFPFFRFHFLFFLLFAPLSSELNK